MDDTLFSSSSAFEDTVFPYDMNVLSFFDLSRDDDASKKTEYPLFTALLIVARRRLKAAMGSLRWISQVLSWAMSRMKR
jgi:hypothetical protein